METTGLFWASESAIKEHQVSVFSLSDVGNIRVCARLHREPCQASNRFALFHVLPTLSFLHIFLFPVTSETASRSLSRGWWCSAVSRATLFCRSSPTETGQSPRMSIRLPYRGRQKQVKLAMDVVERKEAMQEKSENDARKDWVATWKNLKARTNWRGLLPYFGSLVRWNERQHRKCPVIFFPIFSLAGHFFYFQNKVGHGKRGIFAFDYLVGLQTWRGCIDHHVSVGTCLTDLTMMYPAHQTGNTAQAWPLCLCCTRVLLIEDFLLSISLKKRCSQL